MSLRGNLALLFLFKEVPWLPVSVLLGLLLLTAVAFRASYSIILRLTVEVVVLTRGTHPSSVRKCEVLL